VLRVGGVYADVDTECRKPLSGLIRPHDTLGVSWESELGGAGGGRAPCRARCRERGGTLAARASGSRTGGHGVSGPSEA